MLMPQADNNPQTGQTAGKQVRVPVLSRADHQQWLVLVVRTSITSNLPLFTKHA